MQRNLSRHSFLVTRKVLRRINRLKREEVTGGWSKLHNEELVFIQVYY
jgi:hypothetical protein